MSDPAISSMKAIASKFFGWLSVLFFIFFLGGWLAASVFYPYTGEYPKPYDWMNVIIALAPYVALFSGVIYLALRSQLPQNQNGEDNGFKVVRIVLIAVSCTIVLGFILFLFGGLSFLGSWGH